MGVSVAALGGVPGAGSRPPRRFQNCGCPQHRQFLAELLSRQGPSASRVPIACDACVPWLASGSWWWWRTPLSSDGEPGFRFLSFWRRLSGGNAGSTARLKASLEIRNVAAAS